MQILKVEQNIQITSWSRCQELPQPSSPAKPLLQKGEAVDLADVEGEMGPLADLYFTQSAPNTPWLKHQAHTRLLNKPLLEKGTSKLSLIISRHNPKTKHETLS